MCLFHDVRARVIDTTMLTLICIKHEGPGELFSQWHSFRSGICAGRRRIGDEQGIYCAMRATRISVRSDPVKVTRTHASLVHAYVLKTRMFWQYLKIRFGALRVQRSRNANRHDSESTTALYHATYVLYCR